MSSQWTWSNIDKVFGFAGNEIFGIVVFAVDVVFCLTLDEIFDEICRGNGGLAGVEVFSLALNGIFGNVVFAVGEVFGFVLNEIFWNIGLAADDVFGFSLDVIFGNIGNVVFAVDKVFCLAWT